MSLLDSETAPGQNCSLEATTSKPSNATLQDVKRASFNNYCLSSKATPKKQIYSQ